MPNLRNITGLVIALQILASLQVFDQAVVMYQFGPAEIDPHLRPVHPRTGLHQLPHGLRLRDLLVLFLIIAAVALGRMWLLRSREEGISR